MKLKTEHLVTQIVSIVKGRRLLLEDEKKLQHDISCVLGDQFTFVREHRLDRRNIVDFLVEGEVAVEVKIKGSPMAIFYQCERYCRFDEVKAIILLTNKRMTLPDKILGKPTCVINLSEAWL